MKRFLIAILSCMLIAGLFPQAALAKTTETPAYIYGTVQLNSTATAGGLLTDSFCYTDAWFGEDPAKRNDALALASMQLTASSADGTTFLKDLGFEEIGFAGDVGNDPYGCSYTWAKKKIKSGGAPCTLVAVAIQSYSSDKAVKRKGWAQNFTVNGPTAAGEHFAFAAAAEKAAAEIASLCGGENVKLWITGQSRGGAIANLLAAKLPGRLGAANQGIFACTFEAPSTTDASLAGRTEDFSFIHNYICSDDIVPMVPPWGMTVYGQRHELKTKKTDAHLKEELKKLGSGLADRELISDGKTQKKILGQLVSVIPSRGEYAKQQKDIYTDDQGKTVSISYVYQDAFRDLMGVIFGDGLKGFSLETVIANADKLAKVVQSMAEGCRAADRQDPAAAAKAYGKAAGDFSAFAKTVGLKIDLTEADLYALLKLFGPVVIDADYQPAEGEEALTMVLGYLTPGIELYTKKDSLIASHHFDTLVARLKTLAATDAEKAVRKQFRSGRVNLQVKPQSGGKIRVSWKLRGTSGQTPVKYRIYRASSKKGTYQLVKTVKSAKFSGTWTDSSSKIKQSKKGTAFYYKVVAVKKVAGKNVTAKESAVKRGKLR